jgi:queuine/archaeosine tRNA-ribosyltransferase
LARHGGALVLAEHWDEEPHSDEIVTPMTIALKAKAEKEAIKQKMREESRLQQLQRKALETYVDGNAVAKAADSDSTTDTPSAASQPGEQSAEALAAYAQESSKKRDRRIEKLRNKKQLKLQQATRVAREHTNMCKGRMRNDPRPIDPTCGCYTCKNFSRAYLHHLFKAKESLGGTLVSMCVDTYRTHVRTRLYATTLCCYSACC